MPVSHVEQLQQSLELEDREEALIIDAKYDELAANGVAKAMLLEQAIADTEKEFIKNTSLGIQFGWETLKKALRWTRFRDAYLRDLEPIYESLDTHGDPHKHHGLEPVYADFADKLSLYEFEHEHGLQKIIFEGDPLYIETYAEAEKERQRRDMSDRRLYKPFELEFRCAIGTLRKVLDRVLDSSAATGPQEDRQYEVHTSGKAADYYIIRHGPKEHAVYSIGQLGDDPEYQAIPDHSEDLVAEIIYTLVCRESSLSFFTATPWGEIPTDTYQILQMAAIIAASAE